MSDKKNDGGNNGFTELLSWLATHDHDMTLQEAVETLKENARFRTIEETLEKYTGIYGNKDALRNHITDSLMKILPPGTNRDSVRRRVGNWLNDGVDSITKESAVQLCFALNISAEDSDEFLRRCCGEGFHLRDPWDIIMLFALRHKNTYTQALDLVKELTNNEESKEEKKQEDSSVMTDVVTHEVEKINDLDELKNYLQESKDKLGTMHNTAYDLFCNYLALLSKPVTWHELMPKKSQQTKTSASAPDIRDDKNMSDYEITMLYLHRRLMRLVSKRGGNNDAGENIISSAIERNIKLNWPDNTLISRMRNREIDVSRKALMLLFIATDGDTPESAGSYLNFQGFSTPEDDFESIRTRLDAMLADCGFSKLDPRVPFDWMILFCVCTDDSSLVDERILTFLSKIFNVELPKEDK